MRIIIKCSTCKTELSIKEIQVDYEQNSLGYVKPCGGLDCNNCEDCEEAENALKFEAELKELKATLAELT